MAGLAFDRGLLRDVERPVFDDVPIPEFASAHNLLNTGRKPLPSAPESAFYHEAAGTNLTYVDPPNDLVVVARWIEASALDGLVGRVLAALATRN